MFYILENKKVVAADLETFERFMLDFSNKVVAKTSLGEVEVSTVFLGIDHGFLGHGKLFFETMVFGGPEDGEMERYTTYEQAELGHKRMVEKIKATLN